MAQTLDELLVVIDASTEQLRRELKKGERSLDRSTRKMEGSLKRVDRHLALFGAAFAAAIGVAAVSTVKVASDAEEMRAKFETVFGASARAAEAWADQHAGAVGRSKNALMGYMATLQDTFVPLGYSREEAAKFSQTLTELAVDLASFNNEAEADTVQALQSALVGNHETVQRYGIIIKEATLKQELMNMGLADGGKNATEQQKALARLNLILKGSVDAQGDAANTADAFANKMKALKGAVHDLQVELGRGLLPPLAELADYLARSAKGWNIFLDQFRDPADRGLEGTAIAIKAAAEAYKEAAEELDIAKAALGRVEDKGGVGSAAAKGLQARVAMLQSRAAQAAADAAEAQRRHDQLTRKPGANGNAGDPPKLTITPSENFKKLQAEVKDARFEVSLLNGEFGGLNEQTVRVANDLDLMGVSLLRFQDGSVRAVGELANLNDELNKIAEFERIEEMKDEWKDFGQTVADSVADMVVNFDGSTADMLNSWKKMILGMMAQKFIAAPLGKAFDGMVDSFFAGGFANGGTIPMGQFGLVGERGPELATPSPGGVRITPLSSGAASGGNVISISPTVVVQGGQVGQQGMDPQSQRAVSSQIDRMVRDAVDTRLRHHIKPGGMMNGGGGRSYG